MGSGAAKLAGTLIVGVLIVALSLASAGYIPWLAQIVGGVLAVVVFVLILAAIGRGEG